MKQNRLIIKLSGQDVSNECTLKNGKSNPFGWSQYEIHHNGKRIGWLESGYPMNFDKDYDFCVIEEYK